MNNQTEIKGHLSLISSCANSLAKEGNWKHWRNIKENNDCLIWNPHTLMKPTSLAKNIQEAVEEIEKLIGE